MKMAMVTALAGASAVSCGSEGDGPDAVSQTIRVNTMAVNGGRDRTVGSDQSFGVLFWTDKSHLENFTELLIWPSPYLVSLSKQPVEFYQQGVYDTRYPYPDETTYLYATGYAPGNVLSPKPGLGYRKLVASVIDEELGRYDFMGCDVWGDVYKGSQLDPFAQSKNKLYFRHLASKLLFYADRDRNTMENKQYVRNVKITALYMSTDGGATYTPMYTPEEFEWRKLEAADYTDAYTKAIDAVKLIPGNTGVKSKPIGGYKTVKAMPFAGPDTEFVLERHASDRVPVYGFPIDSCYVCNNIVNGVVQGPAIPRPIQLKMDISAELSFDPDFKENGPTTDDLTYTRTWPDVKLDAIYKVDVNGKTTTEKVYEFKPGYVYRVYIHFHRTGVNLVAIEMPWNIGGVHYITIPGGKPKGENQNN